MSVWCMSIEVETHLSIITTSQKMAHDLLLCYFTGPGIMTFYTTSNYDLSSWSVVHFVVKYYFLPISTKLKMPMFSAAYLFAFEKWSVQKYNRINLKISKTRLLRHSFLLEVVTDEREMKCTTHLIHFLGNLKSLKREKLWKKLWGFPYSIPTIGRSWLV